MGPLRPMQADRTMGSGAQGHMRIGRDDLPPEESQYGEKRKCSQELRGKMAGYRSNRTELPPVSTGMWGSDSAKKETQMLTSQASGRFLFAILFLFFLL